MWYKLIEYSRSSRTVVRFQHSPLLLSSISLMTQSITYNEDEAKHNTTLLHTASHFEPQVSDDVDVYILEMPYSCMTTHKIPLISLSNTFLKTTKLIWMWDCHSIHCSIMFLNVNVYSIVPLSCLKPACSYCDPIAILLIYLPDFHSCLNSIETRFIFSIS